MKRQHQYPFQQHFDPECEWDTVEWFRGELVYTKNRDGEVLRKVEQFYRDMSKPSMKWRLCFRKFYKAGWAPTGTWKDWFRNGELFREISYDGHGLMEHYRRFNEQGKLMAEVTYENGKKVDVKLN